MSTVEIPPTEGSAAPSRRVHDLNGPALWRFFGMIQRKDQMGPLASLPAGNDLVRISAPGAPILLVRNAEHAREVLVTDQDIWQKGLDYNILAVLLGRGLLTNLDPTSWQAQRKLIQPIFAKRHLAPMGEHMVDAAGDWLDRLEREHEGEAIDVNAAMMELTLDVVGRALFGASISRQSVEIVGDAMTDVLRSASANFRVAGLYRGLSRLPGLSFEGLLRLRFTHWNRAQRAIVKLNGVVDGLIDARRADPDGGSGDLLSLLLAARDEETGAPMPADRVRDEVMTFLAAGHETTANAMTWMWLLLCKHPEARARMQAEVDEVLEGRTPTFADADRLPYTMAVLQESMRVCPPVPAVSRISTSDTTVGGVSAPVGTVAIVLPFLIHRDAELWPDPERFDPERFMTPASGRPKQAFMPFGAGRRICVGSGFALMEGVLLAAMTAQRLEFDLVPGTLLRREVAITLRPREAVPMHVRRRTTGPALETR